MKAQPNLDPDDIVGDFDDLLRQLETPSDTVIVNGGYAALMARLASAEYRRRCGCEKP